MNRAWALVLLLTTVTGCGSSTQVVPASKSIWPLAVGNWWIGEVTSYDDSWRITGNRLDTISIDSSVEINGETWFFSKQMWNTGDLPTALFTNRLDGLYRRDTTAAAPQLRLKYPAVTGDTFNLQTISNDHFYLGRVDTVGSLTNTPIGLLDCGVFRFVGFWRASDRISYSVSPMEFYSPGVGPVMCGYFEEDRRTPSMTHQEIWRLVSYRLK